MDDEVTPKPQRIAAVQNDSEPWTQPIHVYQLIRMDQPTHHQRNVSKPQRILKTKAMGSSIGQGATFFFSTLGGGVNVAFA